MISLKETISRLGRTVKSIESIRQNVSKNQRLRSTEIDGKEVTRRPSSIIYSKSTFIPDREFKNQRSSTKLYQEFLKPLNLENLKSFEDEKKEFDVESSRRNWRKRKSTALSDQLDIYLENRQLFQNMLNYLIEITPTHLKNVKNITYNQHIITQEHQKHSKIQHNIDCFTEIPKIPNPLTKEGFEWYIYSLTHKRYHYLNSSSLKSGIIPKILLYTHKLDCEKFKPFRSTITFNYLIKYFGFDKNQSLFARELLLVMNKEGHLINEETINILLKIVSKQSKIRSNSNSFASVIKYLKLGQSLGVDINLDTWTRIYDTIGNLHLKEQYLETIQNTKLPITRSLVLRILDDFMNVTKDTKEVEYFIENDLNYKDWQTDELIKNKIIFHKAKNGDTSSFINDDYALKFLLQGIMNDKSLEPKSPRIFQHFCKNSNLHSTPKILQTYTLLIKQLIDEFNDIHHLEKLTFLIRGLIHDATNALNIPTTVIRYKEEDEETFKETIPENYKIIARQTKDRLIKLQASIQYINSKVPDSNLKNPWKPFTTTEASEWNKLKNESMKNLVFDVETELNLSKKIQFKDLNLLINKIKTKSAKSRQRQDNEISKIGLENYVKKCMIERNLIDDIDETE
ncbi:AEP3 [Candida pseudojiufengensis]|uniref:AEP3 n=1 Tax=Candida pseudojiufengensis TaxID=497109 RepID=UPI0022258253|nr:AEP3 [Candida pseudojiufengensis]KAI5962173.1 AEP3 [Candida pseudojiufengensis]